MEGLSLFYEMHTRFSMEAYFPHYDEN